MRQPETHDIGLALIAPDWNPVCYGLNGTFKVCRNPARSGLDGNASGLLDLPTTNGDELNAPFNVKAFLTDFAQAAEILLDVNEVQYVTYGRWVNDPRERVFGFLSGAALASKDSGFIGREGSAISEIVDVIFHLDGGPRLSIQHQGTLIAQSCDIYQTSRGDFSSDYLMSDYPGRMAAEVTRQGKGFERRFDELFLSTAAMAAEPFARMVPLDVTLNFRGDKFKKRRDELLEKLPTALGEALGNLIQGR